LAAHKGTQHILCSILFSVKHNWEVILFKKHLRRNQNPFSLRFVACYNCFVISLVSFSVKKLHESLNLFTRTLIF